MPYQTNKNSQIASRLRPPTIAIIDDDDHLTRAVSRILKANYNCVVNGFASVEDFLHAVDAHESGAVPGDVADMILLDFHLPGQKGPMLMNELKKRNSPLLHSAEIVGITGDSNASARDSFNDAGVSEVWLKPLQQIDFGRIADRAYRVSSRLDSSAPPGPAFKGTL